MLTFVRKAAALGVLPVLALGALFAHAEPLEGQTAEQILAQAMALHEQRLAGVQNVTIRQDVMGFSTTTYMVKEMVDGRPVLRPQVVDAAGAAMDPTEDLAEFWSDLGMLYDEMAHRWTLEGESSVGDRATWRLTLTDFEGLDWVDTPPGQDDPFEPRRMVIELDVNELVPLAMVMEGAVVDAGEARPVTMSMRFEDYRTVDGFVHPFRVVTEMDLAQAGLSPEEVAEAREGMEELRRQLEQVPEAQRAMMEQMMGEQLERLEQMVAGEAIEVELVVTDLQVNAGPPDGR
jgi:hypothetical protein